MIDFLFALLRAILRSWQRGSTPLRIVIGLGVLQLIFGLIVTVATDSGFVVYQIGRLISYSFFGAASLIFLFIIISQQLREEDQRREHIERVEERARDHPDQPQLAWDLARIKLESFLDRNLGQLRSIFWLTSFVMLVGFSFLLFGLLKAYDHPENFSVSVLSSVSGVIISFIGGSFLLIYRSVMAQTRRYVSVLERINAVGMAVQVLGSISEESKELRNQSTAALAKQLIDLYSKAEYLSEEGKL